MAWTMTPTAKPDADATSFQFRLAHLSDPHVGPLPAPRMRDLAGKRMTGYWNWRSGRKLIHNMDMLTRILADIEAQRPDHIALTGDLVNIGLPAEFPLALKMVTRLGEADRLSIIPGNHDAYVRNSMPAMVTHFTPYMRGDDLAEVSFPYMRIRGRVALIGVSSAIPTGLFLASGAVGPSQTVKLRGMLEAAGQAGFIRVVMIHHPPLKAEHFGRGLRDHASFVRTLREAGAELVIHGHNHRQSMTMLERRNGPSTPIVGVASASAVPGTQGHKAAWHQFDIAIQGTNLRIEMATRGSAPDGAIVELDSRTVLDLHA